MPERDPNIIRREGGGQIRVGPAIIIPSPQVPIPGRPEIGVLPIAGGGAVAVPLPVPQPQPTVRTPPVRFPTGPAANDPTFSIAGRLVRIGGFITIGAAALAELVAAIQREIIDQELRDIAAVDALISRRLGADNPLAVITIDAPLDEPLPRDEFEFRPGDLPASPDAPPTRAPDPRFTPFEIPPVVAPPATPAPPEIPAPPRDLPDIRTQPETRPAPSSDPLPPGTPGIGTPRPVFTPRPGGLFSSPPLPGTFSPPQFISPPVTTPVFAPRIGTPLTPPRTTVSPSPGPGTIQLPRQQPQPQPRQRRCKPCRKKKPTRRKACYKGLYREGPMSNQLKKTRWVKIDCSTGRELGKRKRPSGLPDLKIIKRGI